MSSRSTMREEITVMYGTGATEPWPQPFEPYKPPTVDPMPMPGVPFGGGGGFPLPASPAEALAIAIRCGKAEAELEQAKKRIEELAEEIYELRMKLDAVRDAVK